VVFFHFGGQAGGGDVASNVARWFSQFQPTKPGTSEALEGATAKTTIARVEGTMKGGGMGGPKEDAPGWALLGAIIEHEDGPVFVKMTGPSEVVSAASEPFLAMVKAAGAKK
jgi:hypothetical protein